MKWIVFAAAVIALAVAGLAGTHTVSAVPVREGTPKTAYPGAPGAVQVGAQSVLTAAEAGVNAVEMQLRHDSTIAGPQQADAYSYSLIGKTTNGWFFRMGYIVLKSDCGGGGCARWFIQVFNASKKEVYWNLSRAGEANPCGMSCSSGDDTMSGYPFSFVTNGTTASFYFDWVNKARVNVSGAGSISEVFFLGELSFLPTNTARAWTAADLVPRTALTTYRLSKSGGANGSWFEPSGGASAVYLGAPCPDGVAYSGLSQTQRWDGVRYHSTSAGHAVTCSAGILWLPSTDR